MPRKFYVFCRFWSGYSASFPFDRFNGLPDDEIIKAVTDAAIAEVKANPSVEALWRKTLEHEAREKWKKALKHWKPMHYGYTAITPASMLQERRHPKFGQLIHPKPTLEPIPPLESNQGIRYAMGALGWSSTSTASLSVALPLRFIIASSGSRVDVEDTVSALQQRYSNVPAVKLGERLRSPSAFMRFGYFSDENHDRASKWVFDQQVEEAAARTAASQLGANFVHSFAPWVVSATRCALDLLRRAAATTPADSTVTKTVEERVDEYIAEQIRSKRPIKEITRDGIAAATGVSSGAVSETDSWKRLSVQKSLKKIQNDPIETKDWGAVMKLQEQEATKRRVRPKR